MTTFSNKLVDIISNAAQSILSQGNHPSPLWKINLLRPPSALTPVKAKHKGLVSALLLFDEGQNPVTSGAENCKSSSLAFVSIVSFPNREVG